jgi:putative ABC transport system permease protein
VRVSDTVRLAVTAILRNRMRSFLTTLGVIIGVAAVIVLQGMGAGATKLITGEIASLGTNMVVVMPGTARRQAFGGSLLSAPQFRLADVDAIADQCPSVGEITPYAYRPAQASYGETDWPTNAFGVWPSYFEIRSWAVVEGRQLDADDEETAAKVCLLGQTVVRELFGSQAPIGADLRLGTMTCQVVGVLEEKGMSTFGSDQDDVVFLPYATFARRIQGEDSVATIMISAQHEDEIEALMREVTELLRERRHVREGDEDDFSVRDMREMQAVMGTVTGVLGSLLAGVAAISLLVGGIGIMNIMLVSVTERTREIGIRLAVGARSTDVLQQFLVEAIVLSSAGGIVGVVLGVAGTWVGSWALGVPFEIPFQSIGLAFAFSVLVGAVFGGFPARKASRLRPIEALRAE